MALTWLLLTTLTSIIGNSLAATTTSNLKPTLDTKRRHDVVDEAFLEQKDILLDMLESKLKEVRDKKKKKSDKADNNNIETKCEALPSNVDLKLKSSGLSALGETDLLLKFGNSGKGTLNLDVTGISNVGKARLELVVGDGTIYVPGLNNLFVGKSFISNCDKQNETDTALRVPQNLGNELLDYRRSKKDMNEDDQNKPLTSNVNISAKDNVKNDSLATTVAVQDNTVDQGNATIKP